MGQMVISAIGGESNLTLVGGIDTKISPNFIATPSGRIPYGVDLGAIIQETRPDVLVDFSTAKAVVPMVSVAAAHRVHVVSGTTGLSADELVEIDRLAQAAAIGVVVAANFALGAVVMMHLAELAAKYFDYAEIVEEHHEQKLDAPSGTALATAKLMAQARGRRFAEPEHKGLPNQRGQNIDGISIHSVRLPGLVARQEVLFGALGQTLSIKHDAISRECYMPGVMIAIKRVGEFRGLVTGLDKLLGF
jgi:4-hydroxy-tetrahydrodipicolinate reductase